MTLRNYITGLATAALANVAMAETIKNELDRAWAITPKGKFECLASKSASNPDILKFAGKVYFKGSLMGATRSDGTLTSGIYNANIGCPTIVASNMGYVVMTRPTHPTSFGINGYLVLDTNANPPELVEIAESQSPQDDKLPETRRFQWTSQGLTLSYFGYPVGTQGGDVNSPKPKMRKAKFLFRSGEVSQAG
ncbi:hypothetical protein EYS42_16770 [Aquabacterium lacunae]|uniref:Uncharacterized protein n=1 Tax=Aquabacterium lacunae TaxID=2528630 RepID=A0A4Q9GUD2_9BURK|nr:hypothetical protein [Aquabacterium lacunae]TBO27469.1 hypothetical protein EYS42_16770 [Aquabacterium lacunae]